MAQNKPEGPTIIALYHKQAFENETGEQLKKRCKLIKGLIEGVSSDGRKRNLYIEMSPSLVEYALTNKTPAEWGGKSHLDLLDPFAEAVRVAKRKGCGIVPLDKDSARKLYDKIYDAYEAGRVDLDKLFKYKFYVALGLRERQWVQKMAVLKPSKYDLMLMHPDHVRGFLSHANFKPRAVKWLDRPLPPKSTGRLSKKQVAEFLAKRALERRKRQEEIMRRKKLLALKRRV